MRIELRDPWGTATIIHSQNLDTITRWLGEHVPQKATMNCTYMPIQLTVYADTPEEVDRITPAGVYSTPEGVSTLMDILEGKSRFHKERISVSTVKWCDIGQHAFPASQLGATTLKVEQMVKNDWGGVQPQDVVQDVCAACAKDSGIKNISGLDSKTEEELLQQAYLARDTPGAGMTAMRKALGNGTVKADPELYAEYLEWKNGLRDEPGRE